MYESKYCKKCFYYFSLKHKDTFQDNIIALSTNCLLNNSIKIDLTETLNLLANFGISLKQFENQSLP